MHTICGLVVDSVTKKPIAGALIEAHSPQATKESEAKPTCTARSDERGRFSIDVPDRSWQVQATVLTYSSGFKSKEECKELILEIPLSTYFGINLLSTKECAEPVPCPSPLTNRPYEVELTGPSADTLNKVTRVEWHSRHAAIDPIGKGLRAAIEGTVAGDVEVDATVTIDQGTVRRVVTDRAVLRLP